MTSCLISLLITHFSFHILTYHLDLKWVPLKCDPLTEFDCGPAGCSHEFGLNYLDTCIDTCIPKRFVNNGKKECVDGSDEGMYVTKLFFAVYI